VANCLKRYVLLLTLFIILGVGGVGCSEATLLRSNKKSRTPEISILHVIPSSGTKAGGTRVTVQGSGFLDGCSVLLGGVPCTDVTVASPTSLSCTTSAHNPGGVEIVLNCPGGSNLTVANVYAYVDLVNPVPGFAVSSGGGISAATGSVLHHSTIGQPNTDFKQSEANTLHYTGLLGILHDF
jgi:hypothetical protein